MKTPTRRLLTLTALALLGACGNDPSEAPSTEMQRDQALRDSAFGDLAETMDRAAEVEQLQLDRKREIDAALEH